MPFSGAVECATFATPEHSSNAIEIASGLFMLTPQCTSNRSVFVELMLPNVCVPLASAYEMPTSTFRVSGSH
jgi:hypothetical protein